MPAGERVIQLIKKLSEIRFDRGATPSEAAAAAAHIERLLHEHQLSMFDVEKSTFGEEIVQEERTVGGARPASCLLSLASRIFGGGT